MSVATPGVRFQEVTPANRSVVEALTVTDAQSYYVASVAESLREAADTPDACPWYRAVYDDEVPVGFVMLSDGITVVNPDYLGPYFLWRLLIDQRFQGRGYGSAAVALAVKHVRPHDDVRMLLTSAVQGPASPVGSYLRQWFRLTGEVHTDDELVLELDLFASR